MLSSHRKWRMLNVRKHLDNAPGYPHLLNLGQFLLLHLDFVPPAAPRKPAEFEKDWEITIIQNDFARNQEPWNSSCSPHKWHITVWASVYHSTIFWGPSVCLYPHQQIYCPFFHWILSEIEYFLTITVSPLTCLLQSDHWTASIPCIIIPNTMTIVLCKINRI